LAGKRKSPLAISPPHTRTKVLEPAWRCRFHAGRKGDRERLVGAVRERETEEAAVQTAGWDMKPVPVSFAQAAPKNGFTEPVSTRLGVPMRGSYPATSIVGRPPAGKKIGPHWSQGGKTNAGKRGDSRQHYAMLCRMSIILKYEGEKFQLPKPNSQATRGDLPFLPGAGHSGPGNIAGGRQSGGT